jgi:dienelactone hydrolase
MTMMRFLPGLALMLLAACNMGPTSAQSSQTLAEARHGHVTHLIAKNRAEESLPVPPKGVLDIVHYPSPIGQIAGYLTPLPNDGAKHPAIIWISGGDNMIGDFWSPSPRDNDQSARAFREAGIVTFYPSMRGGNGNPGYREGMYGEVDDILAAADWLAKQPGVDPKRIYLGGHSTGGTLVLLVAEMDPRFRATFAFGAVASPEQYGEDMVPLGVKDPAEIRLRAPVYWLESVRSPVFVMEGDGQGNSDMLELMRKQTSNPNIHFGLVPGASHFSILAPATELIAKRILADTGPTTNLRITQADLDGLMR